MAKTSNRIKVLEGRLALRQRLHYKEFMAQFSDNELQAIVDDVADADLLRRFSKIPPAPPELQAELDALAEEMVKNTPKV
jgi:hypothetical protein